MDIRLNPEPMVSVNQTNYYKLDAILRIVYHRSDDLIMLQLHFPAIKLCTSVESMEQAIKIKTLIEVAKGSTVLFTPALAEARH